MMETNFSEYDGGGGGGGGTMWVLSDAKRLVDVPLLSCDPSPGELVPSLSREGGCQEEIDFNDVFLKYVNQILMEEDIQEETCIQESSLALQAAEKSFYEVIGEKYPPPPDSQLTSSSFNKISTYPNQDSNEHHHSCWNSSDHLPSSDCAAVVDLTQQSSSQSLFSLTDASAQTIDRIAESLGNSLGPPDIISAGDFNLHFERGAEEANKFLPRDRGLFLNLMENEDGHFINGLRGRKKNPYFEDPDLECEKRNTKQSASYTEPTLISEIFDKMLRSDREEGQSALHEALQNKVSKNVQKNARSRGSSSEKMRRKKQATTAAKRNFVDLKTLLILCAQAITVDNRCSAADILKQIRLHSSPTGDAMQRLASYFAGGLEARLAGYGTHCSTELLVRPRKAIDILKSHYLFLVVCPIVKIAHFFSNTTIMHAAERANRLHIVDFGMSYGFQWPFFIEQLSRCPGGPPKLRITAVDFPGPGFRPGQLIEEAGRRLAIYAERFNVPFEFDAIVQKWDTIRKEDIKIEENEVLAVNCLYRFRYVPDVSVGSESPRNMVLNLIKDLNPKVFIQGIVNGAQCSPFFVSRFQEAIFYYSAQFDMCETVLPRETPERMAVEKELLGQEIMNLVACEGLERVERPETYKQWQVRRERVGFKQLPLKKEILRIAKERVVADYHEDFVLDEDDQWLVLGWKGRIISAVSSCKPIHKS